MQSFPYARRKYEITAIAHPTIPGLFRIRALIDIPRHNVKVGNLGGYIEKEDNLSHDMDCWISDDACVYNAAQIDEDALICENAIVCEKSVVFRYAKIGGNAQVRDSSYVYDRAIVYGNATVIRSMINGTSSVYGNATIKNALISVNVRVHRNANIKNSSIGGENILLSNNVCIENGKIDDSSYLTWFMSGQYPKTPTEIIHVNITV